MRTVLQVQLRQQRKQEKKEDRAAAKEAAAAALQQQLRRRQQAISDGQDQLHEEQQEVDEAKSSDSSSSSSSEDEALDLSMSTRKKPLLVLLAANLEPTVTPGGLTDQVHALRAAAAAAKVPVGVVSTRNVLKKGVRLATRQSCVCIIDAQGAEPLLQQLLRLIVQQRQQQQQQQIQEEKLLQQVCSLALSGEASSNAE
ncbi:hypothetical protein, conserved [Eimeria tenella]|uniref:Ribosomal protein L7Ae/L30e/S12e/Gadd45 domain-containing protein n=1 Tax=Eimeria tenella TaxID=5802 RepID=U6KPX2_EIMTE|nr:hypothetical protein, conserved [Eimeria tenella]CDJ38948.1 hypothetical protein, conserved [Eimeria tenella]|eukprot:XP_013229703.1 hypothetical protein, conserved [Eimeria tenella]